MRTEQLLRETLHDLADEARTPEVTLARITGRMPTRRAGRRHTVAVVAAAVILLVLAIAVPTFLVDRTSEPVGRVQGNWNLTHRVEASPDWEVREHTVSPDVESTTLVEIREGGDNTICLVEVGGEGWPDPTVQQPDRRLVSINGRRGFYAPGRSGMDTPRGVSWEYQPGAFAHVSCDAGEALDVAVAERVRFGPVPVRLPFRLRSLPPGFDVALLTVPAANATSLFRGKALLRATDSGNRIRSLDLEMPAGWIADRPLPPGRETATVAGQPAVLSARDATLCLDTANRSACLQATAGLPEDPARSPWAAGRRELLVETAERLVLAEDLDDQSTWFPANEAIPS